MKKAFLLFLLIILSVINYTSLFATTSATANCWTDTNADLTDMLNACQPDNTLEAKNKTGKWWFLGWLITVTTYSWWWYEVKDAKQKMITITTNLVILASILAIWWIVYSWIMFTTAYWDDGKIKKAKDAVKWSLIWFLVALAAQQLVNAIINLIYKVWS